MTSRKTANVRSINPTTDNMKPLRKCAHHIPKETLEENLLLPVYFWTDKKKACKLSDKYDTCKSDVKEGYLKKYLELSILKKSGSIRFDSQKHIDFKPYSGREGLF